MASGRHHIELYSPAGLFIGFCSQRKYDWYLKKGIATPLDDRRLRLHFEPSFDDGRCEIVDSKDRVVGLCSQKQCARYLREGSVEEVSPTRIRLRDGDGNATDPDFTLLIPAPKREPQCAICDEGDTLAKSHLVPGCLALEFVPQHRYKNDYVFVCGDCSPDVDQWHQTRLTKLFADYGVTNQQFVDPEKRGLRKTAKAILRAKREPGWKEIDPVALERVLEEKLGKPITDETLLDLARLDISVERDGVSSPYAYIVKRLRETGKLADFLTQWREDLIAEFSPSYMSFLYPESFLELVRLSPSNGTSL